MYAAVLLLGILPCQPVAETTELVEINHCYNRDTGERRFVQIIYWDRVDTECLHVREWHMLDRCHAIYQVYDRSAQPVTVIRRRDCDYGVQIVRARQFKVTHTFADPEEENRRLLPIESRRPLGR